LNRKKLGILSQFSPTNRKTPLNLEPNPCHVLSLSLPPLAKGYFQKQVVKNTCHIESYKGIYNYKQTINGT